MKQSAAIEGTLIHVTYRNEETGYVVARVALAGEGDPGRPVTVVGNLLGVAPGESVRLTGGWVHHARYGTQFKVVACETLVPTSIQAIERYLGSGLIKGIGPTFARRLVEVFGDETMRVIEEEPDRLRQVEGIGMVRLARIKEAWAEQRELRALILFLQGHGISPTFARRIAQRYGMEAIARIQADPYQLAREIPGIGFKTADRVGRSLGVAPDSPRRVTAAILYLLGEAVDEGHLFLPVTSLRAEALTLLGLSDGATVDDAVERLVVEGAVCREAIGSEAEAAIYLAEYHQAERAVAARLVACARGPAPGPSIDAAQAIPWVERAVGLSLGEEQRRALERALVSKVLVITGGPGTGKTTLLTCLSRILGAKGVRVALAAPTGRAARRMAEAAGHEAKTLHRLLEFSPKERRFLRNARRPLQADVVVVDEASMVDLPLMHRLLEAVPPACRLLLIGDADQLPSVGPGSVLQDLIAAGDIAVVRLRQIYRQAGESLIVLNAHRVNRGEFPILPPAGARSPDFLFLPREEVEDVRSAVVELAARELPEHYGLDPFGAVQVLSPMNRGPIGVNQLNRDLQAALNPSGVELARGGWGLRVGDRVMQVRNNYEREVFNGDIGQVAAIDVDDQSVTVRFEEGDRVYDAADLDELTLAYCVSIHKSQGSEYPAVVLPIHTSHYIMLKRNLLYTAMTRARRLAVLVGTRQALAIALGDASVQARHTRLAQRLAAAFREGV